MKRIFLLSTTILITVLFLSCKKNSDSPSSTNAIVGSWNFVSMNATTTSISESSQSSGTQKTVTNSNYTTQNNTGTVTIDASTIKTSNLSYSVNTTAKSYFYQDNVLTDSLESPFTFTVPASSSGVTYKYVSSDSIYFDQGTLLMNGVTQSTTPGGAKIKLEGDMLYITQYVHEVVDHSVTDVTIMSDNSGTILITLKRQ